MEKRKTIYITAAAIAAAGGLAGALGIIFKHQRAKDAILLEQTDLISEEVSDALGATRVNPDDGRLTSAETVYSSEDEQFPEEVGPPDHRRRWNIAAAKIIRLPSNRSDQPKHPDDNS